MGQPMGKRRGPSTKLVLRALCLLGAWSAAQGVAHAAGVEDTVGGTVALGRAANYARVNDFMATWQNPANLAIAPRNVGVSLQVPFFNACFNRAKNNTDEDLDGNMKAGIQYKKDAAGNDIESFAEVCNEAAPLPSGNLGVVIPLIDNASVGKLGLGLGVFTPAGVGSLKFGSDHIVTVLPNDETLPTTTTGTESPNRYLLLDRQVLAAFVTAGLGWAPNDAFRVGASVSWGFADVKYRNVASVLQGFEDQEAVNDVRVRDNFIPRATVSVASTPVEALDLMASLTYTGDISADGYVDLKANGIKNAPRKNCYDANPGPYCRVDDVTLKVPYQRYEVVLGARYADRRVGREGKALDPLADEVWDVELNGLWANTGHVTDYSLDVYEMKTDPKEGEIPGVNFSSDPVATPSPIPSRAALPHNWRDTYAVRLGGDYNVLANKLAVRLGVSYETRGIPIKNMNIDYWPVQKVGAHVGVTYRVGPVDLHAAYVHLWNETVDVPLGKGNINEVTAVPAKTTLAVNEGTYTSSQDIVSLQGNWRF